MARTKAKSVQLLSTADIQQRGRALQERFRSAGIPQYARWMIDHYPSLGTDVEVMHRMRQLFNGAGARRDTELLIKCEALADRFLPQQAA